MIKTLTAALVSSMLLLTPAFATSPANSPSATTTLPSGPNKGPVPRNGLTKEDYLKALSTVQCDRPEVIAANLEKLGFEPTPLGGREILIEGSSIDLFAKKMKDDNTMLAIIRLNKDASGKGDMACVLDIFIMKTAKTTES